MKKDVMSLTRQEIFDELRRYVPHYKLEEYLTLCTAHLRMRIAYYRSPEHEQSDTREIPRSIGRFTREHISGGVRYRYVFVDPAIVVRGGGGSGGMRLTRWERIKRFLNNL